MKTKTITLNGLIAALYVALTVLLAPVSFGAILFEFRISEMLMILAMYNKRLGPGLILGCLIANVAFSPYGMADIIFGTLSTVFVVLILSFVKEKITAIMCSSIVIGIIIGILISYGGDFDLIASIAVMTTCELVVLTIGAIVFHLLFKNKSFAKHFMVKSS